MSPIATSISTIPLCISGYEFGSTTANILTANILTANVLTANVLDVKQTSIVFTVGYPVAIGEYAITRISTFLKSGLEVIALFVGINTVCLLVT